MGLQNYKVLLKQVASRQYLLILRPWCIFVPLNSFQNHVHAIEPLRHIKIGMLTPELTFRNRKNRNRVIELLRNMYYFKFALSQRVCLKSCFSQNHFFIYGGEDISKNVAPVCIIFSGKKELYQYAIFPSKTKYLYVCLSNLLQIGVFVTKCYRKHDWEYC